jgi:flagellar hook assembly protein FlgD
MTKQRLLSAAQAVVINPENAIFPENSKLTINYNDLDNDDFLDISGEISVQRLSIYTYDTVSGTFKFIKSDLNRTDKSLEAPVFKGGTYFLLADIKAPEITVLTSPGEKATTNPKLVYTISDSGSGIDQTKLILQLNGISTPFSFDESSGRAAFFPSAPLSADTTYAVTFFATDNSGNTAFSVVNFTTSDVLKVESSIPYPNPVRGASVKIRYTLTRDADEVLIDIYDTTGDKIFDAAGDTYGGINEFEWNTLSIDGKSLPNDVYFYKITAFNDEYKDINTGKIMLLR